MWPAALLLLPAVVVASRPQVNFPLSLQCPPVARVGQVYAFQFASTTFQPDPDILQYSLVGNPKWLSLDSKNRTLRGTPPPNGVGEIAFTITAAGEAGAVANMESKLLVTDGYSAPVQGNISQILSEAGQLIGPNMLLFPPSKPFEITFPRETIQIIGKSLSYRITLSDHAPLPAWLSFDTSTLRLAGTTPLTDYPQSLDLRFIASELPDYSVASLPFTLVISNHQLLFNPLVQSFNVSKSDDVNITGLRGKLFLDDSAIKDHDIDSATADVPAWLSFDNKTLDITGTPPPGLMSQELSITVKDKLGDTTKHTIHLMFESLIFTWELGKISITPGERFEQEIPRSILTGNGESISFDFGLVNNWLTFDPATFIIHGEIPKSFSLQEIEGSMTATSSDNGTRDRQVFQIQIQAAHTTASNSGNSNANDEVHGQNHQSNSKNEATIAGSIVGGLFAVAFLFTIIVLLCRRKKKTKGYISPKSPRSPRKTDISRPILIPRGWGDGGKSMDQDLEKGKDDDTPPWRTPERPPQLNLSLAKRRDSHSVDSSIGEGETKILTDFKRSSLGDSDEAGPSHRPHDSMKIPTAIARRGSQNSTLEDKRLTQVARCDGNKSDTPGRSENESMTVVDYAASEDASSTKEAIVVHNRLRHGRKENSPPPSVNGRTTHLRSLSCKPSRRKAVFSTMPFPQPPTARHTTQLTSSMPNRKTIRFVRSPTYDSLMDPRTIDEKRKSYIRKRASAQSPFFGASSSRISSSSYKVPPAFVEQMQVPENPSSMVSNTIVKPSDEVFEIPKKEMPDGVQIYKPSKAQSGEMRLEFPGSLRRSPSETSFLRRHPSMNNGDRVQKQCERSDRLVYPHTGTERRISVAQSSRTFDLKSSLNDWTGEDIFDKNDISESAYSSEEEDTAEYKRNTIRLNEYLPPLSLVTKRKSKKVGKQDEQMASKQSGKRELKRASERDPTPHYLAREHGGKENRSSKYSLVSQGSTSNAFNGHGKAKATSSPERPKTAIATERHTRPGRHSRTESQAANHSSIQHSSQEQDTPHREPSQERHSRKLLHSRSQSHRSTTKPPRSHSRRQSSAYPHIDVSTISTSLTKPSLPSQDRDTIELRTQSMYRDLSGNIIVDGDSVLEHLDTQNITLRPKTVHANASARGSLAAHRATAPAHPLPALPKRSSRRDGIPPTTPTHQTPSTGPGLYVAQAEDSPSLDSARMKHVRERTPFGMLSNKNGASSSPIHQHVRLMESRARTPVAVKPEEGLGAESGRRTGNSLRAGIGWDGWKSRESKAFL